MNRSEIAKPAESSFALLMRKPEDKRCNDVLSADWEVVKLRCAFNDAILVLTTELILILPKLFKFGDTP